MCRTLELDHFDGEILFAYTEDLEVAEDGLLRFGVTVDLDAEEVALILPVELALHVGVNQAMSLRKSRCKHVRPRR